MEVELPGRPPLTRRERDVFDFIRTHIAERGRAPSQAEIGRHFGYRSSATAHEMVVKLTQKGWIAYSFNTMYSIEIIPEMAA